MRWTTALVVFIIGDIVDDKVDIARVNCYACRH